MRRRGIGLLAVSALLVGALSAPAQRGPRGDFAPGGIGPGGWPPPPAPRASHRPLSDEPFDLKQAESLLSERLAKSRDLGELQKLAEKLLKNPGDFGLTPNDLKRLQERLQDKTSPHPALDPRDPEMKQLLQKMLDANKLSPRDLERLQRLGGKDLISPRHPINPRPVDPRPVDPNQPPPDVRPPDVRPPRPVPPPPRPAPKVEEKNWLDKQMLGWLDFLADWEKSQAGESSLRDFFRDLGEKGLAGFNLEPPDVPDWLAGFVPSTDGLLSLDRCEDVGEMFKGFSLPSLGGAPSIGGFAGPDLSGVDRAAGAMVPILIGGVALVVVWMLFVYFRGRTLEASRGWHPGAWPVDPSRVRTRADLVRAFEYLALLLLGPRARPRNHCDLASEIGAEAAAADGSRAADELARLYEHARYAPPDEQLADGELATARRDLRLLAEGRPA